MTSTMLRMLIGVWASMIGGCSRPPNGGNAARSVALQQHGLRPGARLRTIDFPCNNGKTRELAARQRDQIVTFSAFGDCSECARHLKGLGDADHARASLPEHFVVVFAPPGELDDMDRLHRRTDSLPVCFDAAATVWRDYDLQNTPFTVLLRDGWVEYLNDAPLDDSVARQAFAADVERALERQP